MLTFNPSCLRPTEYTSIPADKKFALTKEMYLDPLKMYAKAAQSKWGGTLPKDDADATKEGEDEKKGGGVLGMSQGTTVKAAIGVGGQSIVLYRSQSSTRREKLTRLCDG